MGPAGRHPHHVHSGDGYSRVVRKVAVDPDSGWLVTACMDRCVRIWDAATGQSHAELKYLAEWVDHIAIAPDGSWLATAGKNLVHIWDPATGQARPEQSRHPQWVSQLVASADGSR